jgi:hypothetical protein
LRFFFFGDSLLVVLRTGLPGLAPAGHLLSCFAKKVGKEGDREAAAPFGGPRKSERQSGTSKSKAFVCDYNRTQRLCFLVFGFRFSLFWVGIGRSPADVAERESAEAEKEAKSV